MTGDGALRAICRVRELTRSIEPCVLGRSLHAACVSDQEHVEPGEGSCGAMAASGEGVVGKLAHPAESVALIRGEGILHNMIAAILLTLHSLWGLSCRNGQRSSEPVAVDAVVPSWELGFGTACGDGSNAPQILAAPRRDRGHSPHTVHTLGILVQIWAAIQRASGRGCCRSFSGA